jgi:hypothetical protein
MPLATPFITAVTAGLNRYNVFTRNLRHLRRMSMTVQLRPALRVLCLVASWLASVSSAAGLEFNGSLESVTHHAIYIRLNDGRIVFGLLREIEPETLVAKYKIGDQLKLRYAQIAKTFDSEEQLSFQLEVKDVQFLRGPSPEELKSALASRASRVGHNLLERPQVVALEPNLHLNALRLPGSESEAANVESVPGLSRLVAAVAAYVSSLPNYVADETATRYSSAAVPLAWRKGQVLQSEVAFTGSRETRQHILVDGKAWERDFLAIPGGIFPTGGFGDRLRALFSEGCSTFELKGTTAESSKQLLVYRFVTPADRCLGSQISAQDLYYPGYTGQIVFDAAAGAVLSVEIQTAGFPKTFSVSLVEERISWDFVAIGEGRHLLPVSAEKLKIDGDRAYLIRQEYKNHRHFESSTSITFQAK